MFVLLLLPIQKWEQRSFQLSWSMWPTHYSFLSPFIVLTLLHRLLEVETELLVRTNDDLLAEAADWYT